MRNPTIPSELQYDRKRPSSPLLERARERAAQLYIKAHVLTPEEIERATAYQACFAPFPITDMTDRLRRHHGWVA